MARGKRKKNEQDELIPSILEPDGHIGGCPRIAILFKIEEYLKK